MSALQIVADRNMRGLESIFSAYGHIHSVEGRQLSASDLQDADVLLVRSVTEVNEQLIAGSKLRFVGTATSGLEHIDQNYLKQQGIVFAHAQGSNANSVVEYVLSAIAASGDYLDCLLQGASLGIVGHGHVGSALANCARALGIKVRVFDPWLDDVEDASSLEQVLDCKVISLHAELTRRSPWPSFHLLDQDRLAQIAPDALLINASRGGVIDNHALLQQLLKGQGPQCILDVWEGEPAINADLLAEVSFGTAHIAGYSLDAKLSATRMLAQALAQAFELPAPALTAGADAADILHCPAAASEAEQLRSLLLGRYDISQDDAQLRRVTANADPQAAAQGFDQLRRDYRERRELRHSLVAAEHAPEYFQRALGYVLAPSDKDVSGDSL
ncbi:4-phosphoerythronate dehydrogenase [Parahaliea sp. F7430]|uniref:Erythronate-4-phosphate dehydrogenase n=1 Tax=Sediminihaliea albiluteola TaxID=2758564 RepID=A0A7W2TUZ5_9GAMM|nr:4-phosphoerythronate dehydrogenase [Sediminihaliea albiluteola]MBA6412394.1 4-phosphoerythronate dehydrogenase [Sediminihaliea albiluteola]